MEEITRKKDKLEKVFDEKIEVQIVDFMAEYIAENDVPSLIELVLKAIQKVEGEEE